VEFESASAFRCTFDFASDQRQHSNTPSGLPRKSDLDLPELSAYGGVSL